MYQQGSTAIMTKLHFHRHIGKSIFGFVVLFGIFSVGAASTKSRAKQDVLILSEGPNSTTIQVMPDSLGVDTLKIGGKSYINFLFDKSFVEDAGKETFLRQFIPVMVGVFSRQVQVHVLQADYETLSMLPPPHGSRTSSVALPKAVSQFVSYDNPVELRKYIVVQIRVYPFSFDSLSGKYQILKRIVFQVVSGNGNATTKNAAYDKLLSRTLVNYRQVQNTVVSQRPQLAKTLASGVLESGTWYKLSISHSGIYKLTYQALKNAGVPVDNIQLSTIRIFNNGGMDLPEDPNAPRSGDLTENAIYVYDAKGDGMFDNSGDYILFYGKSPREWSYNPSTKTYSHYLNHYTESNFYFMTYGGQAGKRMSDSSYHASTYYKPVNFTSGIAEDDQKYNVIQSGLDWYSTKLTPPSPSGDYSTVLYSNTLNGLDSTQKIIYNISLVTCSISSNYFYIYENRTGTQLGYVDGSSYEIAAYNNVDVETRYGVAIPVQLYTGTGNLPGNLSILKVVYGSSSSAAEGYVDWYEILYKRKFLAFNDMLNFYSPDTNSAIYDTVQGFSSNDIKVFDVSDFANVSMVQLDSTNNNSVYLATRAIAGASKQFWAVGDKGYLSPDSISEIYNGSNNPNLRSKVAADSLDLIIVTAPDFLTQANQLASFKSSFDGLKTMVVTTTDIYNEFGCGIPDPTAIRDFLKYAYSNGPKIPSYVILFGGGTYDYKERAGNFPEYVPPYETEESLDQLNSVTTDDYFVQFNSILLGSPISMSIGRLPVRTTDDATVVVNKIMQYEQKPDYGSWRNLYTLVADAYDGSGIFNSVGAFELSDAEETLSPVIPKEIDQRKIYLSLYPSVVSTEGVRVPQAAADLVNQINDGTLVVNFVGHGAPDTWSAAHVLYDPTTIPQLTNQTRLSLFIGATCDFARDDNPAAPSGAELLVLLQQGGAIGVVSATRVAIDTENMDLNKHFIQELLDEDSLQALINARIGDAFFQTKVYYYYDSNDFKYQYIGDPTVRLGLPQYYATIDSLNGKSLSDSVRQIHALSKVDIKGTVHQSNDSVWSSLSSTGLLTIYDSQRQVPDPNPQWQGFSYTFQGSQLFSGEVSIKNGKFEATAVMPTDISYSDTTGKIEFYFQAAGSDGFGFTTNVNVGGTDTTTRDTVHHGPEMTIYFDSTNFRNGDYVSQNPTLFVNLHSANGINLSDEAVGHSLQATFDGQQSVNLAPFYAGDLNSYQDGTVRYPVGLSLTPGEHSVTVSAFDVFNNESDTSATFNIESSSQLSITNVYNYPDPFTSSTAFTFQRNGGVGGEPINVRIRVFTLSGRLIKTINYPIPITGNETFVKIPWDGLDDDGNRLANGVYLYKVIASTIDGSQTSEALGKMAVLR